MREPPKSIPNVGTIGGGGLMWAAKEFGWQWPPWVAVTVAVVSLLCLLWSGALALRFAWSLLNDWRSHRGWEPLRLQGAVIIGCLVGAAILLVAAAIAYGLSPAPGASRATAAEISRPADITRLVSDLIVDRPNRKYPVTLRGKFAKHGKSLRVYLDYQQDTQAIGTQDIPSKWQEQRRIKLSEFSNFVRGEDFSLVLISQSNNALIWGNDETKKESWAYNFSAAHTARGRLVFIEDDDSTTYLPFAIVSATDPSGLQRGDHQVLENAIFVPQTLLEGWAEK